MASFTGILTDPQFRWCCAIEKREGIDLLNEGQITTLSGRQAQIQVSEVKTIVTGINNQQGKRWHDCRHGQRHGQPCGSCDVCAADDLADSARSSDRCVAHGVGGWLPIQMTIIPTLTEFIGYDLATAATFVPTAITGTGQSINSVLPLPIFRVRQLTTCCRCGMARPSSWAA